MDKGILPPRQQWRKQTNSQTKRVEQWQCRHKAIVGGEVGNGFNLLDVRQNAFMAMDNTFRMTFRTGGKEDQRLFFWLLFYLCEARHQQMREDPHFVGSGDIRF